MRKIRVFEDLSLRKGSVVSLQPENDHILSHVLRLEGKQDITIINGRGQSASSIATKCGKTWKAEILQVYEASKESHEIFLLLSPPKGEALDHIIRQSVEWGVSRILLLRSEFCIRKLKPKILSKARKQSIEALRQSGNLYLPAIDIVQWEELEQFEANKKWLCDESLGEPTLVQAAKGSKKAKASILAVGPEGGWSEADRKKFKNAKFTPVSLSRTVLKSDTAAISALAILRSIFADS